MSEHEGSKDTFERPDRHEGSKDTFERPDRLVSNRAKARLRRVAQVLVTVLLLLYVAIPLFWSVMSSVKPTGELYAALPTLLPRDFTLEHMRHLWFETGFPRYFFNSILVAVGATALTTVLATLGGYGLTRSSFRGKRHLARGILFTYMFPPILMAIPLYVIFFRLSALNNYFTLIVAHTAISLPFGLWIMWQYFQSIPISYEESAWMDGASRLRTLWDVVLPLSRPGIVAVAIFTFAVSWNDYTMAVVIMTENSKYTHPVGVQTFIEQTGVNWGLIQAAGVGVMIPAFLIVLLLQRQLLTGFSVGEMG